MYLWPKKQEGDVYSRLRSFRSPVPLLLALVLLFGSTGVAYAGFGISPPYVVSDRLTRGSVYEQRIMLVRSDPDEDLKATITLNVPGANDWITIDRGLIFTLPKGETQVPITVSVNVPDDAAYQEYAGAIRVRTEADGPQPAGGVSIALGAQIDVALKVVDKIYDFEVRRIRLIDLEEGRIKWGLFFPGKIRFFMTIRNTGNTEFGPTKVCFEIYDLNFESLMETTCNTNKIEKIPPFATKEVLAELPTRLPVGVYTAKYTIYKNEEIAQQNQLTMNILQLGAVAGYEGYGFDGLSIEDKLKVVSVLSLPILLLLLLIAILIWKRRRRRRLLSPLP